MPFPSSRFTHCFGLHGWVDSQNDTWAHILSLTLLAQVLHRTPQALVHVAAVGRLLVFQCNVQQFPVDICNRSPVLAL